MAGGVSQWFWRVVIYQVSGKLHRSTKTHVSRKNSVRIKSYVNTFPDLHVHVPVYTVSWMWITYSHNFLWCTCTCLLLLECSVGCCLFMTVDWCLCSVTDPSSSSVPVEMSGTQWRDYWRGSCPHTSDMEGSR